MSLCIDGTCNTVRNHPQLYIFVGDSVQLWITTLSVCTCSALIDCLGNPKTFYLAIFRIGTITTYYELN